MLCSRPQTGCNVSSSAGEKLHVVKHYASQATNVTLNGILTQAGRERDACSPFFPSSRRVLVRVIGKQGRDALRLRQRTDPFALVPTEACMVRISFLFLICSSDKSEVSIACTHFP